MRLQNIDTHLPDNTVNFGQSWCCPCITITGGPIHLREAWRHSRDEDNSSMPVGDETQELQDLSRVQEETLKSLTKIFLQGSVWKWRGQYLNNKSQRNKKDNNIIQPSMKQETTAQNEDRFPTGPCSCWRIWHEMMEPAVYLPCPIILVCYVSN